MCGIAGGINVSSTVNGVDRTVVERLNAVQHRRGPDGTGLWASADAHAVLGHRRLAIIDTGPQGIQPMSDATGRWTVTFNGEIYNYRALRLELELAGRVFLTNSDTEVLINAVAQWGEAGLRKLRGMYAFALWDACEEEMWLVRDPFGIKPLYVAEASGVVWFASQARALAVCAPVDTRRDAGALTGFYLWGHVPEPFSWWAGIRMFPAGHLQRIRPGRPILPPRAFFRIQDAYRRDSAPPPLAEGELREALLDSIRHHLEADVPVGLFLSAGIDSNVIAALAVQTGVKLHTVTLAFKEYAGTPSDEAPPAEATAKTLQTEHATVRIDREEFESVLEDFFDSMDQPSIDGLNSYLISRALARYGLKVALSGLGGDELFGGYPSFRQIPMLLNWARMIPSRAVVSRALRRALAALPPAFIPPKVAGLLTHSADITGAFVLRRAFHLEEELSSLLDQSWLKAGLERLSTNSAITESVEHLSSATAHAQISALESSWYMRNQLLRDVDWASMAHSVEVRVPFVDVVLFERLAPLIASTAPPSKQDLAACAHPRLFIDIARPKKGFTTPVRDWVSKGARSSPLGLRGWAIEVHRRFRTLQTGDLPQAA